MFSSLTERLRLLFVGRVTFCIFKTERKMNLSKLGRQEFLFVGGVCLLVVRVCWWWRVFVGGACLLVVVCVC